jgi:hypothetical protein
LFRREGAPEGKAQLSLVDMQGRMVWGGACAGGALAWSGRAADGGSVSAGVYAARLTLRDAQGRVVQVTDRKVPYTP